MRHAAQLISKLIVQSRRMPSGHPTKPVARSSSRLFVFLALPLLICACESMPTTHDNRVQRSLENAFQQRIYFAPYEAVWRAAQVALKYPIAMNNMDNGILETDWIRALDGFVPPGKAKTPSAGMRYRIQLTLVKGRVNQRESVKVTIRKMIQKQTDFFADPDTLQTDSLEEKIILYRIERELIIFDALKKVKTQG